MNHLLLFNKTCFECSSLITRRYSTSFSLGIRMFDKRFRAPICGIYGFVRFADEIVDTFHGHPKAELLQRFREDTVRAIEEKISLNPVLHSFQKVVHDYNIEWDLIDAFLHSMEMDLHQTSYNHSSYNEYIYGSAEVVGLMCLRVFCEGDDARYQSLREPARRLGAAFQKINFLRDIKSDFEDRGRCTSPVLTSPDSPRKTNMKLKEISRRTSMPLWRASAACPKVLASGFILPTNITPSCSPKSGAHSRTGWLRSASACQIKGKFICSSARQ